MSYYDTEVADRAVRVFHRYCTRFGRMFSAPLTHYPAGRTSPRPVCG
jgi:hypothetical protein